MNKEAERRLVLAHVYGWSYDRLAVLYTDYTKQIHALYPGWKANTGRCADGSRMFVGEFFTNLLVILPTGQIFKGHWKPGGLLSPTPITLADGTIGYSPPNIHAPDAREIT